MEKRMVWLMVSSLMVLSLVLASCAPKATEEERVVTEEKKVAPEEKKAVPSEEKKAVTEKEVPRYGGVLNLVDTSDPTEFDIAGTAQSYTDHVTAPILGGLLTQDRLKGPAGTGEWAGMNSIYVTEDLVAGYIVESWTLDYPNRIFFHIRKGVRWQDKPPVNGRELTAEDVVASIRRLWGTPGSTYYSRSFAFLRDMKNVANSVYVDPNDPWTAVTETNPQHAHSFWETVTSRIPVWPKELELKTVQRFEDLVGVGPFMPEDYVRGSILTYERNPNHWQKDPLHPENQLPYLDGLKIFIMPDWASRLAALRTGKIDQLTAVVREDAEGFWRLNPELKYKKYFNPRDTMLHMRNDVKPFDDVRVRRAMMMAINHEEILRDYYKGDGEMFYHPVLPIAEHAYAWVPLEQMPRSVQELYEYHPDKAKQLLAEAGYPKGFTTSITLWSEDQIDMASLIAAYWAKVGVTLKVDVREFAVYSAMGRAKSYEHGMMSGGRGSPDVRMVFGSRNHSSNFAIIDEEYIEKAILGIGANYFNKAERGRILKEVTVKIQEDALLQVTPQPYTYVFWQPWLKGYHGELYPMFYVDLRITDYVWVDQELKQKMTGKR